MKKALFAGSLFLLTTGGGLSSTNSFVFAQPAVVTPTIEINPTPPAQVELLDPGAEPRQTLRLQPSLRSKQLSTLTINIANEIMGDPPYRTMPKMMEIVIKIETTVTQIDPKGNVHYQFRYTDLNIPDNSALPLNVQADMRSQLSKLKDVVGVVTVSDRGQTQSLKFLGVEGMDEIERQMIDKVSRPISQMLVAMPEAVIGIGARWRDASDASVFDMQFPQGVTYELLSLQNGVATLKVEAEPQTTDMPVPVSPSVILKSLNVTGQGQKTIRFDQIMPTSAEFAMQSKAEMWFVFSETKPPRVANIDQKMSLTLISE